MKIKIVTIALVVLLGLSGTMTATADQGHSENPRRTWSIAIETGDSYSFTIDTYQVDGKTVTNGTVTEGATITVDVLGNLSEIDVSSLEGLFLTDYSDYFQVTVDEASSEMFDTVSAFLFLYPVIRDEGDGNSTNVFREAVEQDDELFFYPLVSDTKNEIDGGEFTAEIVTDDLTYKYGYDVDTGVLNSYTEESDSKLLEISGNFSVDKLSGFTWVSITGTFLGLIVLLRRKRVMKNSL